MRLVKALYLSEAKQDARDAWAVLDRRKIGSVSRAELEETLTDIFGSDDRRRIRHLLDRLPSRAAAFAHSAEQMIESTEFVELLPKLAALHSNTGSITGYLAQEAAAWLSKVGDGVTQATRAYTTLDFEIILKVPSSQMARAGAVVERMTAAGYTRAQAGVAVEALFGERDTRRIARLWGIFDVERTGRIPVETFDAALPLLTDAVDTPAHVAAVRAQMGFVDANFVTLREFEAALRLLAPADGSETVLKSSDESGAELASIMGGSDNIARLKNFQRQRALRLVQRMRNFGYTPSMISNLCKTLFLTKLHDKDLWHIWVLLHPAPAGAVDTSHGAALRQMEHPLEVKQVRHLLALLSEANKRDDVDKMLQKVDANGSGDIEFEELATLIRAVNPQLAKQRDLTDVAVEAHPLLEQIQHMYEKALLGIMYMTCEQLSAAAKRADKLRVIVRRLDGSAEDVAAAVGGTGTVDRTTLMMLNEVAAEQLATARLGEERGSLQAYCTDAFAEALARYSQALLHASTMLETCGYGTYESHVALRTVRTIEQAERLDPQRRVEWRMDGGLRGGASLLLPIDAKGDAVKPQGGPATVSEAERERRALCLSYAEGGGIRTTLRSVGGGMGSLRQAPLAKGSPGSAGGRKSKDQSMRRRAAEIYGASKTKGALANLPQELISEATDVTGHHQLKDWKKASEEEQLRHAAEVAAEAMGIIGTISSTAKIGVKESAAGEAHRRRHNMLTAGSSASKVADAMADEKPEAIQLAARMHQKVLRSKDPKKKFLGIVLGA